MAEPQYLVNGRTYDWASTELHAPGGQTAVGLKSISYNDEQPVEPVYGRGRTPVAYGRGNYKASGQLAILRQYADEFENALFSTSNGNGVLMHEPTTITVSYSNSDQPIRTDTLKLCAFTKRDFQGKQGDTELVVTYDFQILGGIERDGKRPA